MSPEKTVAAVGRSEDGERPSGGNDSEAGTESAGSADPIPRHLRFVDRTGVPLLVRPLGEADSDRLIAMYETVEATTLGLPPDTREGIERWLSDLRDSGWNAIVRDGDRVVGHVGVVPVDETSAELVVFVHDEYHGRGIGTELVERAVARTADEGYETLTLTVDPANRKARSVYESVGFEVVRRDAVLEMEHPLDDPVATPGRRTPCRP